VNLGTGCVASQTTRKGETKWKQSQTGEIAIFANFTKSTGSFPPFLICLFNLLRMVRLLQLELLREALPTVETDDSIMFSDLKKECPSSSLVL
jgi:hypothetical protein